MARMSERDLHLYGRLQAAHAREVISFYTNLKKLNSVQSPVFEPWLAVGPLVALLMVSITLLLLGGMIIGVVAMIIAVTLYVMAIRPWIEQQLRQRAIAMMMHDVHSFLLVWAYGGVGIAMSQRPETIVAAPDGHWKTFVLKYLPEVQVEILDQEMAGSFHPQDMQDRRNLDLNSVVIPDITAITTGMGQPLEGEILTGPAPAQDPRSDSEEWFQ